MINGVVKFNPLFSEKYLEYIKEIAAKGQGLRLYDGKKFYSDYRIDGFFNYSLKHNLQLEPKLKADIQNLYPYYSWILAPDDFNYTLFTPSWILHNFTYLYKDHYRKGEVLKKEFGE